VGVVESVVERQTGAAAVRRRPQQGIRERILDIQREDRLVTLGESADQVDAVVHIRHVGASIAALIRVSSFRNIKQQQAGQVAWMESRDFGRARILSAL